MAVVSGYCPTIPHLYYILIRILAVGRGIWQWTMNVQQGRTARNKMGEGCNIISGKQWTGKILRQLGRYPYFFLVNWMNL